MAVRALLLVLACTLLMGGEASALYPSDIPDDLTMPEGVMGDRIQLIIDAINNRDDEKGQRFYDEHLSEQTKENFQLGSFLRGVHSIAASTGGIDFHGIRTFDPPQDDRTYFVLRDRDYGNWWVIILFHIQGVAGPVTDLRLGRGHTPAEIEAETITESELASELGAVMESICAKELFAGTVLIASGNDTVFEHACGEASKRFDAPVDMDTKFNIGSMNKMFTAIAVMQLVEKELLSVDDPLSEYLDESWLPAEITEKITIHHLLTHTSGLGSFFNEEFEEGSRKRFRTVDDYRELVAGDTLQFEPGTDWSYSNTGFLLLGKVVESVTGQDYFDYIREHLYAPAGMADTDCYDMDCPVENLAVGYWQPGEGACEWKNNYYEHVIRGGPAGGGFSTAPDLLRFTQALASGVLVSGETISTMWSDHREGDGGYGYGFMRRETPRGTVVGHDGGFTGIEAYYDIYTGTGHTVVVMTNIDEAAWPVDIRIRQLMERLE